MTTYCVKCKSHQDVKDSVLLKCKLRERKKDTDKIPKPTFRVASICIRCEKRVSVFVSVKDQESLEEVIKRFKLARSGEGIRDLVNRFNLSLPFEAHMWLQDSKTGKVRKASFCGPGTKLSKRLESFDKSKSTFKSIITPPVNALDTACMKHDIAYSKHKDIPHRNIADAILAKEAEQVQKTSKRIIQRANASIVKNVMKFKVKHKI